MLFPSLHSHSTFFLRQLLSPSRIQALFIRLLRALPNHFVPPGLLQNQVFSPKFLSLLLATLSLRTLLDPHLSPLH